MPTSSTLRIKAELLPLLIAPSWSSPKICVPFCHRGVCLSLERSLRRQFQRSITCPLVNPCLRYQQAVLLKSEQLLSLATGKQQIPLLLAIGTCLLQSHRFRARFPSH